MVKILWLTLLCAGVLAVSAEIAQLTGEIPWENLMDKLSGCPRLLHVESEPAGMKTAQKIIEAAEIYRELPGIGK